jgi:membrane fusion protein, multidrug efflux system
VHSRLAESSSREIEKSMTRDKDSKLGFAVIAAMGVFIFGCAKKQPAAPVATDIPVIVARASQQAMPVEIASVGNVEAKSTVSVRSQVAGPLLEVHFKEGDFVHKGQLLLSIDPRPFQAQVEQARAATVRDQADEKQAEASLAKDSAQESYARGEAQRYTNLLEKGLIPKETAEQMKAQASVASEVLGADRAAIDKARASLAVDQGALNAANLQLSYCSIYSPIDGRTGAVMQKPGNLLKASDVPIVVINQVDPIDVNFTIPQQYWSEIKSHTGIQGLRVTAAVPQDSGVPLQGSVSFVDNSVDPTTGTIHLRATFDNSQNRLWPGLFVNAVLRLSEQPNAVVVPMQALTQGQNGTFVYVVKAGNTVETRPVQSSRAVSGLAVIDHGVEPGETVVIDGQTRLAQNAKVQIKNNLDDPGHADESSADSAERANR